MEWALRARHDSHHLRWFECYIDVGYLSNDDVSFDFLDDPEMQTLRVVGLGVRKRTVLLFSDVIDNSFV